MFPMNVKASEQVGLLAQVNPVSTSSAVNSGWVSAQEFQKFLAIINVGTFGSSATVDAKLRQATDSSGTNAKDITGKAITQLAAGTNNICATIDLDAQELDVANSFDYIELVITVGTAATVVSGDVIGFNPRYAPGSSQN